MPPKRSTSAYKPTRVKLEDAEPLPISKSGSKKRNAIAKSESDDETLRRSPRKRQRVNFVEPTNGGGVPHPKSDDESSLTSLEQSDYEETAPSTSTNMNISKFAYSRRAPSVKTPRKQVKLEDVSPDFKPKPKAGTRATKSSASPSKKSNPSPRKQKAIVMQLDKAHPTPPNWERQYKLIQEMRENIQAPVDTMGCCKSMSGEGELRDQRFGTLVSLMLSSQTRDEATSAAVDNLRRVLPGGLTVSSILAAESSTISDAINKVGFWRRKTEYLKSAAATLRDKFDGDVPKTVDELCSLQGVGPKMAFLVAWDINAGIGVDVHVHRITNRLGWHKPETTTPEQTRLNLQSWIPRELHKPINPLLVGFGQVICLPIGPRCDSCTLATEGLCPSVQTKVNAKGRKPIVYTKKTKTEVPDAPDLDVVGLIRVEDEVKKEEEEVKVECDIGEPRVQIKFED